MGWNWKSILYNTASWSITNLEIVENQILLGHLSGAIP